MIYIFNKSESRFTGVVSYYKITSEFMYELGFEKGERKQISILGNKDKRQTRSLSGQSNLITTESCFEIYLITYWSDGSVSYDYMYTYCNTGGGDCHSQRLFNYSTGSATIGQRCGPWSSGGGAGSGSGNQDYGFDLPDVQKDWEIARAQSNSWSIIATTRFSGLGTSNGGNVITSVTHLGDNVFSHSEHLAVSWNRQGVTTNVVSSGWIGTCTISGKLTTTIINGGYVDPSDVVTDKFISKNKIWNVNEIW